MSWVSIGPVVTVGHDWGGPVSLGWALRHRDRLAGVVLTNTAVSGTDGPAAAYPARPFPIVLRTLTVRSTAVHQRGAVDVPARGSRRGSPRLPRALPIRGPAGGDRGFRRRHPGRGGPPERGGAATGSPTGLDALATCRS